MKQSDFITGSTHIYDHPKTRSEQSPDIEVDNR
jgi:hypothetical protein